MRTRRHLSSNGPVPAQKPQTVTEGHTTVLLHETIQELALRPSDVVLDATIGGAGHAYAIAKELGTEGMYIGIDADADALLRAKTKLVDTAPQKHLVHGNFRNITTLLEQIGVDGFDKAVFDLGWSGYQLAAGRGFSFMKDEPLVMTYADVAPEGSDVPWRLTAREIVNEWAEDSIADVIYGWGQDRFARRIAKAVVAARALTPIETSGQLAEIILHAVPRRFAHGKTHPATKTFQALRIAVNDEFTALAQGLMAVRMHLREGGIVAVISFHSGEDRIVKKTFRAWEEEGFGKQIPKKPLLPTRQEIVANPRSRSAKLRLFHR